MKKIFQVFIDKEPTASFKTDLEAKQLVKNVINQKDLNNIPSRLSYEIVEMEIDLKKAAKLKKSKSKK